LWALACRTTGLLRAAPHPSRLLYFRSAVLQVGQVIGHSREAKGNRILQPCRDLPMSSAGTPPNVSNSRRVHWYMHISTVGIHFDWSWRAFLVREIANLAITAGLGNHKLEIRNSKTRNSKLERRREIPLCAGRRIRRSECARKSRPASLGPEGPSGMQKTQMTVRGGVKTRQGLDAFASQE
jgi:hypothetical protein